MNLNYLSYSPRMRIIPLIDVKKIEMDLSNLGLVFYILYFQIQLFQQFLHELQDFPPLVHF